MNETVAPVGFHRGRIDRPKSKVIVSPGGVDAEIIVFASVPAGKRNVNETGIGVAVETEAARRIGLDDVQPVGDGNAREQFFPLVITAVGVRIDVDTSAVGCGPQADAAKQQLELAKVNLSYTSIKSPIDGRIGKVNITEGNYVTPTSGSLVNISSTDPVYVTFSLKDNDFVNLLRSSDKLKDVEVKVQFDDGDWYPYTGKINFVDNKVDKDSGTITTRATFENPKGWLVPGTYMKVSLTAPKVIQYMTVPQACTKGDPMSGYYVWTVEDNKAVRKNIKVSDDINNNWVVDSGLEFSDVVVVSGIQNINSEGQKLKIINKSSSDKEE